MKSASFFAIDWSILATMSLSVSAMSANASMSSVRSSETLHDSGGFALASSHRSAMPKSVHSLGVSDVGTGLSPLSIPSASIQSS